MFMSPAVLGTKNDCAGEGQELFARPHQARSVLKESIMLFDEELLMAQLTKKIPSSYGIEMFFTVFTRACTM
jgi:hypothetical protein